MSDRHVDEGEQNTGGDYRDGILGGGSIGGAIGAAAQDAATGIPTREEDEAIREETEYRDAQTTDEVDDADTSGDGQQHD